MLFTRIALILGAAILLFPAAASAQKKLNAGPYWNTNFEFVSKGASSTSSSDGGTTVTTDTINTINCYGCDTREYYPGTLFNVHNNTRKPLCFSFRLTLKAGPYNGVTSWGSGQVFLLKGGQTLARFAGVTMDFGMEHVDSAYSFKFGNWSPVDKKSCGRDRLP